MSEDTPQKPPRKPATIEVPPFAPDHRLITYLEEPQGIGKAIWEHQRWRNRLRRLLHRVGVAK